jgi:rod shape-determining protein MreC
MQRLINILLLFKEYVVLALLIIVSTVLLSLNDNVQMRAVRSYTVGFIGFAQDMLATVPNVFELRRENAVLRQLNVNLSDEVGRLREARLENLRLRGLLAFKQDSPFHLVAADVVGKSFHLLRNTITLNVGAADSIRVDMPIISESGLVGKVIAVSQGYAIGQLMFNKDFRASAKVQRSRVDGIVSWEGGDVLRMRNVAKMQDVREGDVITTSEYSNIFPRNIKIGYISRITQGPGTLFKEIDVTPSAELLAVEQVFIVTAAPDSQRVALEKILTKTK